ncbi:hypothetical protein M0R45_009156 [Rubus argutus]|uniref:Jacalin-type lectin domain-containing protein n=1 Tax=Rubus argutus TaxID=59490 RepID=A0AAW1Y448_RUBAR
MAHSEEKANVISTLYGGSGGSYWDDGLYYGVKTITLRFGRCIDSIAVEYHRKGEIITANKHGGDAGGDPEKIDVGPEEFIKTVSGYIGAADWTPGKAIVIQSLKFESNIRSYGPYGEEKGEHFTFTVNEGEKISGFIGRGATFLDAIGFHVIHT